MTTYFLVTIHEILSTKKRERVKCVLRDAASTYTFADVEADTINKDLSRTKEEILNPHEKQI
jgi:hypothetical protein